MTDAPRTKTAPVNVGISLSGGGVRAAAFGLGALQALQDARKLVRGPKSAKWLAAVSGGSYIAAAVTLLNAGSRAEYVNGEGPVPGSDLPEGTYPFAPASSEYGRLLTNSNYIARSGVPATALLFLAVFVSGILTFLGVMVAVAGLALILAIAIGGLLAVPLAAVTQSLVVGPVNLGVVLAVACWASAYAVLFYVQPRARAGRVLKWVAFAALGLGFAWRSQDVVRWIAEVPALRSPDGLGENFGPIGIVLGIVAIVFLLLVVLTVITRSYWIRWVIFTLGGTVLNILGLLLGILVVSWMVAPAAYAVAMLAQLLRVSEVAPTLLDRGSLVYLVVGAVGVIFALFPISLAARVPYQDRLSRAFFARIINGSAHGAPKAKRIALSSLAPIGGPADYPRLVICASANVVGGGENSRIPAGRNVLPLVFRPDVLSIPTDWHAELPMTKLETALLPISLANAVTVSSAAVSPAMGRMSPGALRGFLALLNIRLGSWLPNPLTKATRVKVRIAELGAPDGVSAVATSAGQRAKARRSPGFVWVNPVQAASRLISEALGIHVPTDRLVYATDGGHYENLGLTELIRQRCDELWVVDSATDPPGTWSTLEQAMTAAQIESGCTFDVDMSEWRADESGNPVSTAFHGNVSYLDGRKADIHIFKIGVTAAHPAQLREYRKRDRAFPYHSLVYQVFPADRFEKYREMAYWTVTQGAKR